MTDNETAPNRTIIRVNIEVEELGVECTSAYDLADLCYGIDDGQVDGRVIFLD